MTVNELRDYLDDFDGDAEVYIGEYQKYGSDFAYNIDEVESDVSINGFYDDEENAVLITMGSQIGTICTRD